MLSEQLENTHKPIHHHETLVDYAYQEGITHDQRANLIRQTIKQHGQDVVKALSLRAQNKLSRFARKAVAKVMGKLEETRGSSSLHP